MPVRIKAQPTSMLGISGRPTTVDNARSSKWNHGMQRAQSAADRCRSPMVWRGPWCARLKQLRRDEWRDLDYGSSICPQGRRQTADACATMT